jgi:AraC family transcriptional regulator
MYQGGRLYLNSDGASTNSYSSRHRHELANIAFVLGGSFTEILDNRRIECTSQSLLIKPPGEAHANRYGYLGMRGLLIEFQPHQLDALCPSLLFLNQVGYVRGGTPFMLAMRIYKELRLMDRASPLAREGLILDILAELSRRPNLQSERRLPHWLERAKEILHEHCSETISLGDVAKTVEIHPVHLAREFRRFYGCTLGEYLRGLRIQFACRKHSTSDMPLVEIALAAGFSHQAHFSRLFKRHCHQYSGIHFRPRDLCWHFDVTRALEPLCWRLRPNGCGAFDSHECRAANDVDDSEETIFSLRRPLPALWLEGKPRRVPMLLNEADEPALSSA